MNKFIAVKPSASIIFEPFTEDQLITKLGTIAAVAYQSPDRSVEGYKKLLTGIMKKGHTSVLEHHSISLSIIIDRATTHALVRHRHTAYTQESTIYCTYKNQLTFVEPIIVPDEILNIIADWYLNTENPTKAKRDILPNMTKSQLIMTTNIREWRYILGLRTDPADSGRMHDIVMLMQKALAERYPFFFAEVPQVWV